MATSKVLLPLGRRSVGHGGCAAEGEADVLSSRVANGVIEVNEVNWS